VERKTSYWIAYASSTPPLDRAGSARHFAGVEEGCNKWEEVLHSMNICLLSLVNFNGPEYATEQRLEDPLNGYDGIPYLLTYR